MKKNIKIANILPLTENYSIKNSGAASLLVRDNIKYSIFKHSVFGSTENQDYPSKNYFNIKMKKSFFRSANMHYVKQLIKHFKKKSFDIFEIHNRPEIALNIKKKVNVKTFLYFHNDPLSLRKSRTDKERLEILNNIDYIFFVSEWVRSRFFENLKFKNTSKCKIVYPTIHKKKINLNKKKKYILFIGKLNKSKGYHIFVNVIKKILDKHKDWSAATIGTEPREKISLKHTRVKHFGWLSYKDTMKQLTKSSIVISPSTWDEPFGRVVNESTLYGNATISSNTGGIPETNQFSLNIKNLSPESIFKEVDYLIENPKILKDIQKKSINGFRTDIKNVIENIDEIRKDSHKKININLNKKLKILHITDQHFRHSGRLYYSTGRKLTNGFLKNGHNILNISDRDIMSKTFMGQKKVLEQIFDTCSNFRPDLLLFGHADKINAQIIVNKLKNYFPGLKYSQWFLDPVIKNGPDYEKNKKRLLLKSKFMEATFLTTDPNALDFKCKNAFFIPNPVDQNIDNLRLYEKKNQVFDLFFALSHGQHRGVLKRSLIDDRQNLIRKLNLSNNIKMNLFGVDKQPIWGDEFFYQLSLCKMGLNLSRGSELKYYSSDRMASLMGNGVMTLVNSKYKFDDFFSPNELVSYTNFKDLNDKINFYKSNEDARKKIAKNGMNKYHKIFSTEKVCEYMLSKIFDFKINKKEKWMI
ncbi:glycosyltransferase [Candidatus Pelagibacter sp. HIMB1517]|uniref:glycosyltransferase n=1 Tax=Candidatus Pelagibacter sp. HIMB1517 TaxID=3413341 RepID=UPI003F82536C